MPQNPFEIIPASVPFVYFCIGLIEVITGRPFQQLADSWMTLKGWQRGVLGTIIVLVAGAIVIIVVFSVFMWFNS